MAVHFGALLRRYRDAAALTQEELAERSGVSVRAISDLERGAKLHPQRATLQLLAEGLGLTETERAALEAGVPGRHRPPERAARLLDLPVGGFLGAVPEGPLVARTTELEHIREVAETVRAGAGHLLLLAGEPGVGKTRMAQEVTLICRASGMHLATGRCYEPQQAVAFYPFLEILSRLVTAAQTRLGLDPLHRWPQLGPLIPGAPPALVRALEGEGEQQRLFWSVAGLLEALAGIMPVVVALDDLHWADHSSLDLLQHLARQLRHVPILLLGTCRDVAVGRAHPLGQVLVDLRREHLVEEISVSRLSQAGTAALLASLLDAQPIASGFVDLVHRHTEGNAFFVQEVVRTLIERGDVFQHEGVWECREVGEITIPRTIHEAIGQRLARLSEVTQAVLEEASVLGQIFGFDELQAMGNRSEEELEAALTETVRAWVVRVEEGERYRFNHALIQRVLYGELGPRRRKRLHGAAGMALAQLPERIRTERAAELAWHFLEGGEPDQALEYAVVAGDQAERRFAHAEAERHYRIALELAQARGDTNLEAVILEKLGRALKSLSRHDEALDGLEKAAKIHRENGNLEAEVRLAAQVGQVHAQRGTSDEGVRYIQSLLSAVEHNDLLPGIAGLYTALSFLYFVSGRYQEEQTAAEQASLLAKRAGDDRIVAGAEVRRASAMLMLGQLEPAVSVLGDAIPLADQVGDLDTLHFALRTAAETYRVRAEFDQCRVYRERQLDVAQRSGDPALIAFTLASLGRVEFFQGAWDEASERLEQSLTIADSIRPSWFSAYPSLHFGEFRLAQGAREEALDRLETFITIARRNQDMQGLRMVQQMLAEDDLLHGNPEKARDRLVPLLDRPGLTEVHVTLLLPALAHAEMELGNQERAAEILTESLSRAASQTARLATLDALRVRGVLLSKQQSWTEAQQTIEQAETLARAVAFPYAEARILYEQGRMHSKRHAHEQARDCLRAALAIFLRLGAGPFIEWTEDALAALQE